MSDEPSSEESFVARFLRGREIHRDRSRVGLAPQVGQLLEFDDDDAADVLWAIVKRVDEPGPVSFYVVPADGCPLVGLNEIRVESDGGNGPRSLRCGHGTWCARAHLSTAYVCGSIEPEDCDAAWSLVVDLGAGRFVGNPGQDATESDPEYVAWMERVSGRLATVDARFDRTISIQPRSTLAASTRSRDDSPSPALIENLKAEVTFDAVSLHVELLASWDLLVFTKPAAALREARLDARQFDDAIVDLGGFVLRITPDVASSLVRGETSILATFEDGGTAHLVYGDVDRT